MINYRFLFFSSMFAELYIVFLYTLLQSGGGVYFIMRQSCVRSDVSKLSALHPSFKIAWPLRTSI